MDALNIRLLARLGAMAALAWVPVGAAANETTGWLRLADMPTARLAAGAASAHGRIYVIGGCRVENRAAVPVAAVEEYDPQTNTWRSRAPLPTPRSNFGIAVVAGRIFIIGGTPTDRNSDTAVVEAYDPVADKWNRAAQMPTSRCQVGAAAFGGKIYVIGGNRGHEHAFELYDPVADRWSALPPLPKPRCDAGVAILDGRVYVSGGLGYDARYPVDVLQAFDPRSAQWSDLTPARIARCDAAFVAVGPTLVALGGYHRGPVASVEMFDVVRNTWERRADLPVATQFQCAAVLEEKIYVFGGSHRLPTATNEGYVWSPADR